MSARRTRPAALVAAALPVLLAGATGCFGPTRQVLSRAEEPSASMRQITARSFDDQHADLVLELEVDNPGSELALASADYELLAQGRAFAVGTARLDVTVPAGGHARVTLPLELAYLALPYTAHNLVQAGKTVQLVARGTLRGAGASAPPAAIPFDGETEIGLTFGPEDP